jgi:hypothetical protein
MKSPLIRSLAICLTLAALACGEEPAATDDAGAGGVDAGVTADAAQGECEPGAQRSCYTGQDGTEGVGLCVGGIAFCDSAATWGP